MSRCDSFSDPGKRQRSVTQIAEERLATREEDVGEELKVKLWSWKSSESLYDEKCNKIVHTSTSDYWKEAFRNHWPIFIQGFLLLTIIVALFSWRNEKYEDGLVAVNRDRLHLYSWRTIFGRLRRIIVNKILSIRFKVHLDGCRSDWQRNNRKMNIFRRKRSVDCAT